MALLTIPVTSFIDVNICANGYGYYKSGLGLAASSHREVFVSTNETNVLVGFVAENSDNFTQNIRPYTFSLSSSAYVYTCSVYYERNPLEYTKANSYLLKNIYTENGITLYYDNGSPSGYSISTSGVEPNELNQVYWNYTNIKDLYHTALLQLTTIPVIPITYTSIGCTLGGPESANTGDDVSVIVTPESGRIIRDPTQGKGISVYNKNGYIPFTYTDGTISFTVPSN